MTTRAFDEAGDAAFLLKRIADRQVQFPGRRDYWPDKMHLASPSARVIVDRGGGGGKKSSPTPPTPPR